MGIPKDKALSADNMIQATEKLYSASLPIVDELTADSARVDAIRSYLNDSVLTKGNELTVGDAGMFAGVTIQNKQVTNDQRSAQDVVIQGLTFFMSKDDQNRDSNGALDPQTNGRRWKKFSELFGLDISELDKIRTDAGIGFISPKVIDGNGETVSVSASDSAQRKAEKRKQATSQRPQVMPKIGAASPQTQGAPVADRADLTASSAPVTVKEGDKPLLPLQAISVLDCMEIEPKRYLVDGLIEAGTITQYAGKEKGGKTYTLMHMALSMSAGLPWLGRETMSDVQGGVLWLNLDMSRALGKRRIYEITHGIEESFDKRDPELFSNFHLMDSQTFADANRDGLQFFTDNTAIDGLREYIISENIKCCFLDNFIQIEGQGQENVSNDMRTVLNRMKTLRDNTDCAFVFIHHTDKAGNRGRGSSDIFAETDLNLQLEPDTRNTNLLKLVTDGSRNSASQDIGMLQEWKQRIDDDGQPMTDANGHPVYIYLLRTADVNTITTAKEERSSSGRVNKTISDNIEKIKDVFRSNGNTPLSKNKIIENGKLSGTKDTRIASIDHALSENILKTDTGLLFSLDDGII